MSKFSRPKTTVGMKFEPAEWAKGKGDVKTRPDIHQILIQQPLESDGPAPFTVFYAADDRLYRVDGVVPKGQPFDTSIYRTLEAHWWRYDPVNGPPFNEWENDGR